MDKKNRRKALEALAVGATAVWAKPVVDSVVLPVHAQTSCPICIGRSVNTTLISNVLFNFDRVPNGLNIDGVSTYVFDDGGTYDTSIGDSIIVWVRNGTTLTHDLGRNIRFYIDSCSTLNQDRGDTNQIFYEPGATIVITGDETGELNALTETCVSFMDG